jgi:L-aminopeptidase/D-esterase-like protein
LGGLKIFDNITDVSGIKVGNMENIEALTGCTVVLAEDGAVCGVDVSGSAPGTRETDLLDPVHTMEKVHGVLLSGGSAFGLDAAGGVMQYLEEKGIGQDVEVAKVPIVPAAVLFDLPVGDGKIRPDKEMGYAAAKQAKKGEFALGNKGAGCGATVGKVAGFGSVMKGGLGSASLRLDNGVTVGALVAVNAVGDIRDPETGEILAGPVNKEKDSILDSLAYLKDAQDVNVPAGSNTTIGVVAANVDLTKAQATKVAQVTQNALARTIYPAHTTMDGDTIFAIATGGKQCSVDLVATMAVKAMEIAIIRAIKTAESVNGIPSYTSLNKKRHME